METKNVPMATPTIGRMRAKNQKALIRALENSDEVTSLRNSIKRKHGFDPLSKDPAEMAKFPIREAGFSWKKVYQKLQEADSASSFPQVLRAGVQSIANEAYQTVETTFEDWTSTVNSTKDTELYAPLQGIGFPREVGRQETYPEVGAAGLDISLKNRKFGTLFGFEYELGEDDQTGQFERQSALLGEYMHQMVEVLCYGKLASVPGMSYGGFEPGITETKPTDEVNGYPYATAAAPFIGGGYNRPATFTVLTQAAVQAAKIALMNQQNKLGLKMSVDGGRLLVGPNQLFQASILLNSAFYPSVSSGTAGAVGGSFAINPVKGIADLTVSRFMFKNDGTVDGTSMAWYLCDDSKPFFVVQLREAMSVIQESPDAGESFNRDVIRFKARMRGNADFIDPRFVYQGNDGSITS